jgi:Fic family protein
MSRIAVALSQTNHRTGIQKYMTITGVSKATATRDLQDLADKNIFRSLPDSGIASHR